MGRLSASSTISRSSPAMSIRISLRSGGYRRIMPFLFSLLPRRRLEYGSAKYVSMPGSSRRRVWRANSVPLSCVTPARAPAGSGENAEHQSGWTAFGIIVAVLGIMFARHTRLRDGPGMDTYFADPYSSRRRGSNENRNGMIRRYPPKRSEIRMDMAGELREIVDEADNRPMRVPGYRTPAEAFADEPLELQDQQGCCTSK